MKILFVYPRFRKFLDDLSPEDRSFFEPILGGFKTPPSLGIPILAALTPSRHHVELLDDNLGESVRFDTDADLVAINCFTPQATRAFELADGFRAAGKRVIMGGIFPSAMPDEVLEHADAVNIGEGEPTWRGILEDAERGELKRRYLGGKGFDLASMPIPDRSLFYAKAGYDWHSALVQIARGCGYNCAMCVIPEHFGHRIRFRPIADIVEEIRALPYDQIYLADDTLFLTDRRSVQYATDLFAALAPLKKRLFLSSTLALNTDLEFLKLARTAGTETFYCTLNVDPVSMRAIYPETQTHRRRLIDLVHAIKDLGIHFYASFGIGRDWDDASITERILELSVQAGIDIAEFFIFSPFPGSVQFQRMNSQKRLLHRRWELYNGANVVYLPLKMDPDVLQDVFMRTWREFYRINRRDWVLERMGKHTSKSPHPDHDVPGGLTPR